MIEIASCGSFQAAAKVGEIEKPIPPPVSLPDPGTLNLDPTSISAYHQATTSSGLKGHTIDTDCDSYVGTQGKGKMEGPMAVLHGVNVNDEIMDEQRFDVFSGLT
jgi:hypothetical protein